MKWPISNLVKFMFVSIESKCYYKNHLHFEKDGSLYKLCLLLFDYPNEFIFDKTHVSET
jgi:hypothetical protein